MINIFYIDYVNPSRVTKVILDNEGVKTGEMHEIIDKTHPEYYPDYLREGVTLPLPEKPPFEEISDEEWKEELIVSWDSYIDKLIQSRADDVENGIAISLEDDGDLDNDFEQAKIAFEAQ